MFIMLKMLTSINVELLRLIIILQDPKSNSLIKIIAQYENDSNLHLYFPDIHFM